jgi:nucleoside 2-deoxyribosyltransferase
MKIYLAHPISFSSFDFVMDYFNRAKQALEPMYDVYYPMIAKGYFKDEKGFKASGYKHVVSCDHAIIERDYWMVSMSDVVFVDLSESEKVSIGCMMELAWAYQLRKHTIVVFPIGNIHAHSFVREAADILFDNYDGAIEYLIKLAEKRL